LFSATGVAGAWIGSTIGKAIAGRYLLILYALALMMAAAFMVRRGARPVIDGTAANMFPGWRLALSGGATGTLAGFFGIGGGFLIVPALIAATGMPVLDAIGSSLMAVTAFGLTTAVNYARSGWVD
jgi:uncharacterized protein